MTELTTARLALRPWTEADLDPLHQMWLEPDMCRFLWDDAEISRPRAAETLRHALDSASSAGFGFWTVHRLWAADDASLAGFCGFRFIDDTTYVEILYGLRQPFWGLGFATEAACAALEWFWHNTDYPRVFARIDPPNLKSIAMMRRLGMKPYSSATEMTWYVLERSVRY